MKYDSLVLNPKTQRYIKKNGKLYQKLIKEGIKFGKKEKKRRRFIAKDDVSKKARLNSKFEIDRTAVSWSEKKPHTMSDRRKLYDACGKDAFLVPEKLKFPICNKVSTKKSKCVYNCKGLKAASSRAGEWKYKNVLSTSKTLTEKLGCYKKKAALSSDGSKKKKP